VHILESTERGFVVSFLIILISSNTQLCGCQGLAAWTCSGVLLHTTGMIRNLENDEVSDNEWKSRPDASLIQSKRLQGRRPTG
jgi:hypothetical protein